MNKSYNKFTQAICIYFKQMITTNQLLEVEKNFFRLHEQSLLNWCCGILIGVVEANSM